MNGEWKADLSQLEELLHCLLLDLLSRIVQDYSIVLSR